MDESIFHTVKLTGIKPGECVVMVCRLEGWDVWELPRMLLAAVPAPPEGKDGR